MTYNGIIGFVEILTQDVKVHQSNKNKVLVNSCQLMVDVETTMVALQW